MIISVPPLIGTPNGSGVCPCSAHPQIRTSGSSVFIDMGSPPTCVQRDPKPARPAPSVPWVGAQMTATSARQSPGLATSGDRRSQKSVVRVLRARPAPDERDQRHEQPGPRPEPPPADVLLHPPPSVGSGGASYGAIATVTSCWSPPSVAPETITSTSAVAVVGTRSNVCVVARTSSPTRVTASAPAVGITSIATGRIAVTVIRDAVATPWIGR